MDTQKPIEFNGTAGAYFILSVVTLFSVYVPLFGWAFLLNYMAGWLAQYTRINGRPITFRASYFESLVFVVVNTALMLVTLGIYSIWFVPKLYRYVADRMYYIEESKVGELERLAQLPH